MKLIINIVPGRLPPRFAENDWHRSAEKSKNQRQQRTLYNYIKPGEINVNEFPPRDSASKRKSPPRFNNSEGKPVDFHRSKKGQVVSLCNYSPRVHSGTRSTAVKKIDRRLARSSGIRRVETTSTRTTVIVARESGSSFCREFISISNLIRNSFATIPRRHPII